MTGCPIGFRIVGPCSGERRAVDWQAAFSGYAGCVARARVDAEAYLSAFTFSEDFANYLRSTGSTRGFSGSCGSPWLWFDIDRDPDAGGIGAALDAAGKLSETLAGRFDVDDTRQLWFFSGSKGFHVGIPTGVWNPEPGSDFHRIARRLAETIAEAAGTEIDVGIYDKVRAFRAPNSRHAKTGRHKVLLTTDELRALSADAILTLAERPRPFDVPDPPTGQVPALVTAWADATQQVQAQAEAVAQRRAAVTTGTQSPILNRLTLEFIREGAAVGDRHRLLFSAAANLSEFGCPPDLAHALLSEAALDSGLPPRDVHRQIECGLAYVRTEDKS